MPSEFKYNLSAVAITSIAQFVFDEICEHFVEHAEVQQTEASAFMTNELGNTHLRFCDDKIFIDIASNDQHHLELNRTMLAEHLFYYAGKQPFELTWSKPEMRTLISNFHDVTVVSTQSVTPQMRRVILKCDDVLPLIGGNMHVRILVPPKDRDPVWPGLREDGRVAWPKGDDALTVRIYTIRYVDEQANELWLDFLQHPQSKLPTPGADFARDAKPGDKLAIVGPGGGQLPNDKFILLAGDESALPAIARIIAEAEQGTEIIAIIEVQNILEEQPLPTKSNLKVSWLHRDSYENNDALNLANYTIENLQKCEEVPFVWFAAERAETNIIKQYLKSTNHDKKRKYVAWYWEKNKAQKETE